MITIKGTLHMTPDMISYTPGELCKKIKEDIESLKFERRRYALEAAKGAVYDRLYVDEIVKAIEKAEKLLSIVESCEADTRLFTIKDRWNPFYNSFDAYIMDDVHMKKYSVGMNNDGPYLASELVAGEKDFVNLLYWSTSEKPIIAEDKSSYYAAEREIHSIKSTYRIFRCKDCGNFTKVLKSQDEHMLEQGLKPILRCPACRKKRREAK